VRFVADENIPRITVEALQALGHDVTWIKDLAPSTPDEDILADAQRESRVLITFDKDFGDLTFKLGLPAYGGVILLRLTGHSAKEVTDIICARLSTRETWAGLFSVIDRNRVRSAHLEDDLP
jgi:predicted nuclease of predicted toxin-antitoxin system